jgi:hypothetical protein
VVARHQVPKLELRLALWRAEWEAQCEALELAP